MGSMARHGPYGPRPRWARAQMGQGPYGPGPIWAGGHMGPWAPGPSLLGKHLTKKRTLEKRVQIMFFVCFLETKKMRDVRTIILAAVSRRDLCYVSENKGFRFAKNKLIQNADPTFIARRSRAHFCFMKFIPIHVLVSYEISESPGRRYIFSAGKEELRQ